MPRPDMYTDQLRQVVFFQGCSRAELERIARQSEARRLAVGTTIVTEGKTGAEFFVIIDGAARVSRQGRTITTLQRGDAFGELALLGEAPRNATIVAETDVEVLVIGEHAFVELLDEVPGFALKLLRNTARRLREADAHAI
jgi:CRP-like cAMP-binding protein